jgi:hypothetical protein
MLAAPIINIKNKALKQGLVGLLASRAIDIGTPGPNGCCPAAIDLDARTQEERMDPR